MAVDDVGREVEPLADHQRGVLQREEPPMLVGVARVEPAARVQRGAVDEVHDGCARDSEDLARVAVAAQRDLEVQDRLERRLRGVDLVVQRQDHARVVARAVEIGRQGGHHIREAAGLGEGRHLRRNEQHVHGTAYDTIYHQLRREAASGTASRATFSGEIRICANGSNGSASRSRRTSRHSARPGRAITWSNASVLGCSG